MMDTNDKLVNSLQKHYLGQNCQTQEELFSNISENLNLKQCSCVYQFAENIKNKLNFTLDILIQSLKNQQQDCQLKNHNIFENNTDSNNQLKLLNSCFRQMDGLNKAIDKILGINTSKIEENLAVNLVDSEFQQVVEGFEDLQRSYFKALDGLNADNLIYTIQMSLSKQKIVCCGENNIKLWKFNDEDVIIVGEAYHKQRIQSVAFIDNQELLAIGDLAGCISTYDTNQMQPNSIGFRVHQGSVIYLAYRSPNHIISCSDDNTIVTSNIELMQIVQMINYDYPCQSGFDYSYTYDFILSPNNKNLSLYDGFQGMELCQIEKILSDRIAETFIQVVLSQDQTQALVSLHEHKKIFHIKINIQKGSMFVQHNINAQACVQNISWCLDDKAFVHIFDNQCAVRYLNDPNFPLLMQNQLISCQNLNIKQDPSLNYILVLHQDLASLGKKTYWM